VRLGEFALVQAQIRQSETTPDLISADSDSLGEARRYAFAGFHASGLQSGALRVLAIADLAARNEPRAVRLAEAAERLTRRDGRIQLLLFRNSLLGGHIEEGLRHFDLALRANHDMRQELFPALASALREDRARKYFAPFVRADNGWLADFLVYALNEGPAPVIAGQIIAEAEELPARPGMSIEEIAIPRMVQIGEPSLAREISNRLPASMRPAPRGYLSNPTFTFDDQTPAPFGWSYSDRPELTIRLPARASDRGLQISSTGNFGAELARQLLTLEPGTYRLAVAGSRIGNARWIMACAGSGIVLLQDVGVGVHPFLVPERACEGQWLRLVADGKSRVDLELSRVSVEPMPSIRR
jgi:hypothetical protein